MQVPNKSYTCPKPVLELLLPKSQVPKYWVPGPLGREKGVEVELVESLQFCEGLTRWTLNPKPLNPQAKVSLPLLRVTKFPSSQFLYLSSKSAPQTLSNGTKPSTTHPGLGFLGGLGSEPQKDFTPKLTHAVQGLGLGMEDMV